MKIDLLPLSRRAPMAFGDLLREIDDRDCVTHDDFILCYADTVCTANLEPVIRLHKERRAANPMALMTKVFAATTVTSRRKSAFDDSVVVYDSSTSEMICWQSLVDSPNFVLPNDLMKRNSSGDRVQIRYDLADFGVSICSKRVLKLFSEAFDCLCFRKDFCYDLLSKLLKEDIIYTHVLEPADSQDLLPFTARVTDFRTMLATCFAIQERAAFPVVLDCFSFDGVPLLISLGRACYKANSAQLHESALFGPHSVILSKSTVGANSKLSHCVVGRNCRIANNCELSKCILLDGVVIEDGVVCDNAFISRGVIIRKGAKVKPGVVLGSDVIIGEGILVPALTRIGVYEEVPRVKDGKDTDGEKSCDDSDADDSDADDSDADGADVDDAPGSIGSFEDRELSKLFVPGTYRRIPDIELEEKKAVELVGRDGRGVEYVSADITYNQTVTPDNSTGAGHHRKTGNSCGVMPLHCLGTSLDEHIKLWMPGVTSESDDAGDESSEDSDHTGDVQSPTAKQWNRTTEMDTADLVRPGTILDLTAKTRFGGEIHHFVDSGLQRPDVMHHKIMEMKSFRLSSNLRDIDVLCEMVAPILDHCRHIPLEFDLWATELKSCGAARLFSAFLDDESANAHWSTVTVDREYLYQWCGVCALWGV
eukprot:Lankesteria_metandrocarpae@DN5301_c0_g1_i1.p1